MFIILSKNDHSVVAKCSEVDYLPNGYPIDVKQNISYVSDFFEVLEVESVPAEVELAKFCYTKEKGFYPNPNWVEPKPYTQEQYDAVLESLIAEGRL